MGEGKSWAPLSEFVTKQNTFVLPSSLNCLLTYQVLMQINMANVVHHLFQTGSWLIVLYVPPDSRVQLVFKNDSNIKHNLFEILA